MNKNKKLLIALLSASMVFSAGFALAGCDEPTPEPPPGPEEPVHTAPVITVLAGTEHMEIEAGEDFDPLFGVSAVDDEGKSVEVTVKDDDGFDNETEGEYTFTYTATANGLAAKDVTRVVEVIKAGPALILEARDDRFNKPVWESKEKINFRNREYRELTQSATYTLASSGVFYNKSQEEITLNMDGSHGCSAVIDEHGVVIEGRDGANGNLVNEAHPARSTSSAKNITIEGVEYSVSEAFAKDLKIPAGGWAIVVQSNYAGVGADADGRGYMNYNVIYEYGNVVRLSWADKTDEYLTEYVDQKPTVSKNSEVVALQGDTRFVFETEIKKGLELKDDNGTFEISDDIDITEVTIVNNGNFDINTVGDYLVTLSITDGTLVTEFTRKVRVIPESEAVEVAFLTNSIKFLKTGLAYNQDLTSIGSYNLIVYDYEYKQEHATLGIANGHGVAYIINRYGKIVRTYDGANATYSDETKKSAGGIVTGTTYIQVAYASLQEGEYIFIAPHNETNGNSSAGGTRERFMQKPNREAIGAAFSCTGFEFEEKAFVLTIGEGDEAPSYSALENKYAYNQDGANAASLKMLVYTKAYSGEIKVNGYGIAVIIDKNGVVSKIYCGTSHAGIYDSNGKTYPADWDSGKYAQKAFNALQNREVLVVFPHSGTTSENPRDFIDGFYVEEGSTKTYSIIGQTVTLTDFDFTAALVNITIGDNKYEADSEKIAINSTTSSNTEFEFYIYTTAYSGTFNLVNQSGEAFVISGGKIVRIYDGADALYFDAEHTSGQSGVITNQDYLTVAFASLKANEYLLVAPNDGGSNLARQFLRANKTIGADFSVPGMEIAASAKEFAQLTVNGKIFYNPVVAVNTEVASNALSNYDFAIYSYGYSGIRLTNGWSVSFVIDQDGKVVKVYDAIANKYFDLTNTGGIAHTGYFEQATASLDAFNSLKPGETLIVGLNGGMLSNRGRAFLNNNRVVNVDVTFKGITVAAAATEKVEYMSITLGGKTWYQDVTKVAHNAAYDGNPVFAVYDYGYDGTLISNSNGEAFIVDKTTGKIVRIYDGASAKYFGPEEGKTGGATDSGCTAADYITEAFAALQDGQMLVIATNGGTTGNVARGFFYSNRNVTTGTMTVTFPTPATPETPEE